MDPIELIAGIFFLVYGVVASWRREIWLSRSFMRNPLVLRGSAALGVGVLLIVGGLALIVASWPRS
jgi:hypothetical protein